MEGKNNFEVVIIGGSYAGLSSAMTLGRSLREVLIIDGGKPCNQQTPYSHNFMTQDGVAPAVIAEQAKRQVLNYRTVSFVNDNVMDVGRNRDGYSVFTQQGNVFYAQKLLFATGVQDKMPTIKGFSACWGISVLHCPYCHGYEVAHQKIGILANGDVAFELCKLIQHWTKELTLFTNGPSTLNDEQINFIENLNISIVEKEIDELQHRDGHLESIQCGDGKLFDVSAIFSRVEFEQHCHIPFELGCQLTETGHLKVDSFQKTTVDGIYAAGDNASPFRTVSFAVSAGTNAGVNINKELIADKLQLTPQT